VNIAHRLHPYYIQRIQYVTETVEKGSLAEFCHWINAHPQMIRQGTDALKACCFAASEIAGAWMERDFNQQETYPGDCTDPLRPHFHTLSSRLGSFWLLFHIAFPPPATPLTTKQHPIFFITNEAAIPIYILNHDNPHGTVYHKYRQAVSQWWPTHWTVRLPTTSDRWY
jgi:hypothetical protein